MPVRVWSAITTRVATTAPAHADTRLRGRTYPIPFEDVWNAAHALASVGMRGLRLVHADDENGVIRAEARTAVGRKIDDLEIRIGLDENGQTRVDATSSARQGRGDWGRNARRLNRIFRALDRGVVDAQKRRRARKQADARAGGGAEAGRTDTRARGGSA